MKISLVSSKTCTTFLFSNEFKQVKATKVQEGEVIYWKIKGSKVRYDTLQKMLGGKKFKEFSKIA